MSLPRYPAYKDSGVSWLGEVPAHWRVDRFKNVVRLRQEIVGNKASDYLLLSLTLQGVIPRDMDNPQGKFPSSFDTYQVVKKGDVVFCLFDVEETPRGVGLCNEEGMLTGAYTVVRPLDAFDSRFVFYYYYARDQYKAWRMYYTGLRNVIRWDNFCSIPFLAPSLEEQREISDFLDRETAKIDALIAEQEKLIALLAEKRQATISRAVTRGLDPNVPLKDSGVPWLGKVPAHWSISRVKFYCEVKGRIGFRGYTTDDQVDEGEGALVLGATQISKTGKISIDEPVYISWEKYYESPEIMISQSDVLVVQRGSTCGKIGIVTEDNGPSTINPSVVILKNSSVLPSFLFFFLSSDVVQAFLNSLLAKTAIPMLSQEQIGNIFFCVPGSDEQKMIVRFVERETARLDIQIAEAERAIDLLKERRAALISAAVTGKIDVRGLAA